MVELASGFTGGGWGVTGGGPVTVSTWQASVEVRWHCSTSVVHCLPSRPTANTLSSPYCAVISIRPGVDHPRLAVAKRTGSLLRVEQ